MAQGLWKIVALSLAGVLAIFVLMIAATAGAVLASQRGMVEQDIAMLSIIAVMAVLMMALALWVGVAWMRRIDEAAREAHKAAWFYGGSAGMAVGGVFVVLAGAPSAARLIPATLFPGRDDPAAYAAGGAMAMMILMLIGYSVVWGWWWLRRR